MGFDGDRLAFILEDGRFTITARVGNTTQTYRIDEIDLMELLQSLRDKRSLRVAVPAHVVVGAKGIGKAETDKAPEAPTDLNITPPGDV